MNNEIEKLFSFQYVLSEIQISNIFFKDASKIESKKVESWLGKGVRNTQF